jgi:hypothetical protein
LPQNPTKKYAMTTTFSILYQSHTVKPSNSLPA